MRLGIFLFAALLPLLPCRGDEVDDYDFGKTGRQIARKIMWGHVYGLKISGEKAIDALKDEWAELDKKIRDKHGYHPPERAIGATGSRRILPDESRAMRAYIREMNDLESSWLAPRLNKVLTPQERRFAARLIVTFHISEPLLNDAALMDALQYTANQRARVKEYLDDLENAVWKERPGGGGFRDFEAERELRPVLGDTFMERELTEQQRKAYAKFKVKYRRPNDVFADKAVCKSLQITEQQLQRLELVGKEYARRRRQMNRVRYEAWKAKDKDAIRATVDTERELRKAYEQSFAEIFTAEQRKGIDKLIADETSK